jgi:hypothetical protein
VGAAEQLARVVEQAVYEIACGPAGEELECVDAPRREGQDANGNDRWTMAFHVGGGREVRIRLEESGPPFRVE